MATATGTAKQPGTMGTIITMAALTVLAIGAGGLVGKLIGTRIHPPPATAPVASATPQPYTGGIEIKELPPIVANLADSGNAAVRLQVAIVYNKKPDENVAVLTARIGDDLVAFLKTLTLAQLQGASGLQNLREDLNERASIRSQGSVREVIIETLVTQ